MKPIPEADWIHDALACWHGYNPDVRCDCSSVAVLTGVGWLVFDPLPLARAAWDQLLDKGPVRGIFLTSGNHQRDSLALREESGAPIHAPASSQGEVEADVWHEPGGVVEGFFLTPLPGGGPGEGAWCDGTVLVIGDAVIHLDGLAFLPDKYCEDPKRMRRSLKVLGDLHFDSVFFAHGLPIMLRARERLGELLAS